MTNFGRSITIHLIEGSVSGIRTSEIGNHNIQSFACPWAKIKDLKKILFSKGYIELKESGKADKPGIYFLLSENETGKKKVYIGEGEDVFERLDQHKNKEFGGEAIIFISNGKNLTKSHVRYLESRSIEIARSTGRDYIIENDKQTKQSPLHPAHRDDMEEFLVDIKLLLGVFGHKVLEELISEKKLTEKGSFKVQNLFIIKSDNISSTANLTDEGLVVLKGSQAKRNTVKSMKKGQPSYYALRGNLIAEKVLVLKNNKYIFQKNHLFNSPSAAAAVILGRSANGLDRWKDSSGKSLKDIVE